ncbi:MAG: hypothetical protein J2P17_16880 [Mycobacterium sp.]|nr:hypothetical protein [Mycobacterium sp.]
MAVDCLAQPEDLATFLRQDVDTAWAELVLSSATGTVRDYCGWDITAASGTVVLDTDGQRCAFLPCLHVTAVTSVLLDGEPLDADSYSWSEMGAISRQAGPPPASGWGFTIEGPTYWQYYWPPGFRRLQVEYTGGYDPVPPELIVATCSIASRNLATPGLSVHTVTVGLETITEQYRVPGTATGLLPSEQIVLDRYRLPS